MFNFFRNILLIIFVLLLFSCEKEVTLDLPQTEDKIVIEGAIEQGQFPYVIITRNSSYFEPVDTNTIVDMLVTTAIVTVTDGEKTDSLTLSLNPFVLPYIMYMGHTIKGEVGKTYTLNVKVENKTYSAKAYIPPPVPLDSIRFKYVDQPEDSIGLVWIYFQDPDTLGNFYRGYTKTLNKDKTFVHPYSSVSDDLFANGRQISYALNRGWDPAQGEAYFDDEGTYPWWSYILGETVVVKFCTLDATHYDFWYSVEQQMATDGNPFASPTSIRTNIEGGAIGIWGGYGVYLDTIKIENNIILTN